MTLLKKYETFQTRTKHQPKEMTSGTKIRNNFIDRVTERISNEELRSVEKCAMTDDIFPNLYLY